MRPVIAAARADAAAASAAAADALARDIEAIKADGALAKARLLADAERAAQSVVERLDGLSDAEVTRFAERVATAVTGLGPVQTRGAA